MNLSCQINSVMVVAFLAWSTPWIGCPEKNVYAQDASKTVRPSSSADKTTAAKSVDEARTRARILHETIHGTLQVVHRDFFKKDDAIKIPSKSMEDVFKELTKQHGIKLSWISVELEPMNIDNAPKTTFEKMAAAKLKERKAEFELVSEDRFQYASRIKLSATCLSCHAPRRSDNKDRFAGLVIEMPLVKKD